MMRHHLSVVFCTLLCLALAVRDGRAAPMNYILGHAHIGIDYDAGAGLDLHFHAEGATLDGTLYPDNGFEPGQIVTVVPETTQQIKPVGSLSFLGVADGETYCRLSYDPVDCAVEGTPFFGFGTEEIADGTFVNDRVTFALTGVVSAPTGGYFSLYKGDGTRLMDTADEVPLKPIPFDNDSFSFPTGTHGHYNFAFSAPGTYQLEFTALGALAAGGTASDSAVFTFQVVPEPGTVVLLLSGGTIGLRVLRRRKRTA